MQKRCNQQGITIIELLIVLALIAIVTLIATPLFTSTLRHYRISTMAENLFYALQNARMEALKRNATITVQFSTEIIGVMESAQAIPVFVALLSVVI